jgi:general secretion pathway protein C
MMKRLPLLFSLLAVIALSASLAYWVMQLYKPPQRPLAAAPPAVMPEPGVDAAATLFGGQAAAVVATNYQLTGVVAAGRESVAIIVADGTLPKALKIGKEVLDGVTVQEVHPRYVMLSEGGVLKRIDLATDAKAGNGLSPPPVAAPAAGGANQPPEAGNPPPPPPPAQMPPPTRTVVTPGAQTPTE